MLFWIHFWRCYWCLTVKRGAQFDPTPRVWFSKNAFSKESETLGFFVIFNIIISHVFRKNFIEIPQVVQKIWRFSSPILTIFIDFFSSFWLFHVAKKLMKSTYNRWCQNFFTFKPTLNSLFNNDIKLYWY